MALSLGGPTERIPARSILSLSRLDSRRRVTKGALTPSFSTQPDQKQTGEAFAGPLVSFSCTLPALSLS